MLGSASKSDKPTVIVVGAYAPSLVNFRGSLIQALTRTHHVVCVSEAADGSTRKALNDLGVKHIPIPIQRNGLNPWQDLNTLRALRQLFASQSADVVLAYTVKPVVWSGIALRTLGRRRSATRYIALITGLGYAFESRSGVRGALQSLVATLYRTALRRADRVIFQNDDNRQSFIRAGIVGEAKTCVVDGSGVDLERFQPAPIPPTQHGRIRFLLIARLLGEKGIREFARAAEAVKQQHPDCEFVLVGPEDSSPDGIRASQARAWSAVDYLGPRDDVREEISRCHVYVLPSYHEGMPRTVLEAMAMGRPILTTAVSGCRETVIDGENGWLVPKADASTLAERMLWFVTHPERLETLGANSQRLAAERFDVKRINQQMVDILSGKQTTA